MELRTYKGTELRVDAPAEGEPRILGLGIPFDSWSADLGGFVERIAPDAEIDLSETVAVLNHNNAQVLGRQSNGKAQFIRGERGISYDVEPPGTTWANDMLVQIARRDIEGNSFAFSVKNSPESRGEAWAVRDDGMNERTLLRFQVFEMGPQTFPAYPATDVGLRGLFQEEEPKGLQATFCRIRHGLPLLESDVAVLKEVRRKVDEYLGDRSGLLEIGKDRTGSNAALFWDVDGTTDRIFSYTPDAPQERETQARSLLAAKQRLRLLQLKRRTS